VLAERVAVRPRAGAGADDHHGVDGRCGKPDDTVITLAEGMRDQRFEHNDYSAP
jgi:hypothetical protein